MEEGLLKDSMIFSARWQLLKKASKLILIGLLTPLASRQLFLYFKVLTDLKCVSLSLIQGNCFLVKGLIIIDIIATVNLMIAVAF